MWDKRRYRAILHQRCPVCLEGPMFSGLFTMYDRCPHCGHVFEREPGFFQGAMYVSYALGAGLFSFLGLIANFVLVPRVGLLPVLAGGLAIYLPAIPIMFRYARVIWAHANIGSLQSE